MFVCTSAKCTMQKFWHMTTKCQCWCIYTILYPWILLLQSLVYHFKPTIRWESCKTRTAGSRNENGTECYLRFTHTITVALTFCFRPSWESNCYYSNNSQCEHELTLKLHFSVIRHMDSTFLFCGLTLNLNDLEFMCEYLIMVVSKNWSLTLSFTTSSIQL